MTTAKDRAIIAALEHTSGLQEAIIKAQDALIKDNAARIATFEGIVEIQDAHIELLKARIETQKNYKVNHRAEQL